MFAQFFFLLQIVTPVFAVMGVGYAMRKIGVLSAEADRSMTRVVVVLLAPCLAFDSIIGNEALLQPINWLLPPLLGFLSVVLGIVCARMGARAFGLPQGKVRRTFVFTAAIQNYGYIPLPLCAVLFPPETIGVLFAYCLGVEFAFWSIALWQLTGSGGNQPWWRMINPVMVAIPVAIVLNILGAGNWMPDPVRTMYHMLGLCTIPLALLLSGALIADYWNLNSFRTGARVVAAAGVVRIMVVPALIMAVAWLLPVGFELKAVLVVEAAMPAGIFSIVVTKAHEGDVPVALKVVIGTSIMGLVTIPLWLGAGMHWILGPGAILP